MAEAISPAQRTLEAHLDAVRFQCGAEEGRWEILKYTFPHLYVRVTGKDPDSGQTFVHDFHLECTNYPATGPFVERWTYQPDDPWGTRPQPPPVGSPSFVDAMKWDEGIYRAWQRGAAGHNEWAKKRPDEAWYDDREITFIMEHLYALVTEQAGWLAS